MTHKITEADWFKSRVCRQCGKAYSPQCCEKCKKPYEHTQVDSVRRDEDWG